MSSKGIQLKHKIIIGVLSLILIVSTMMAVNLSKAVNENNLIISAESTSGSYFVDSFSNITLQAKYEDEITGEIKNLTQEVCADYDVTLHWQKYDESEDVFANIYGATDTTLSDDVQDKTVRYRLIAIPNNHDKDIIYSDEICIRIQDKMYADYQQRLVVPAGETNTYTAKLYDLYGNEADMTNFRYYWSVDGECKTTRSISYTMEDIGEDDYVNLSCTIEDSNYNIVGSNEYYLYLPGSNIFGFMEQNEYYSLFMCSDNTMTKVANPVDGYDIKYTSNDPDIATVDEETGKVTATGVGETEIYAYYYYNGVLDEDIDSSMYRVIVKSHRETVDEAVAPTATKTGLTRGKHCRICGTVLVAQQTIPATGNNQTPETSGSSTTKTDDSTTSTSTTTTTKSNTTAVATVPTLKVNETETASNGATVTALSDSTVSLKNKTVKSKQVIVPGSVTVNGVTYTVTTLQKDCFNGATVTKASLPTTITKIDAKAFAGDKKLRVLNINSKKLTVSKDAFKGLKNSQLKKIKVTVSKKNMNKTNYKKLRKQLIKAGIKWWNIKYR